MELCCFYLLTISLSLSLSLHSFFPSVFGSFFDISAYAFYAVQRDLEFRKQWDKLVLKLDIVEVEPSSSSSTTAESLGFQEYSHNHQCPKTAISNQTPGVVDDTGNELVHWVMKYPVTPFFALCSIFV